MRHRVKGKKLNRNKSSRKALKQTLSRSLVEHGEIKTTEVKAKYLRSYFEKLVTISKKDDLSSRRRLIKELQNKEIANKLLTEIGPANKDRNGGYTRIRKIGTRKGDVTDVVQISIIDTKVKATVSSKELKGQKTEDNKKTTKSKAKKETTSKKKETKKESKSESKSKRSSSKDKE